MKPLVLNSNAELEKLDRLIKQGKLNPDRPIHAYKYVLSDDTPPYYGHKDRDGNILRYVVGYEYSENRVSCNVKNTCGRGINIATFRWCKDEIGFLRRGTTKLLLVECYKEDIACIPISFAGFLCGKFRVRRMDVIARVSVNTGKRLLSK